MLISLKNSKKSSVFIFCAVEAIGRAGTHSCETSEIHTEEVRAQAREKQILRCFDFDNAALNMTLFKFLCK